MKSARKKEGVVGVKLSAFKKEACEISSSHSQVNCPFYHSQKDRRRTGNYSSQMCQLVNQNTCNQSCTFSHNMYEQLFRPSKYKTKFCSHYPNHLHLCPYGLFCGHAHMQQELRVPLIHLYTLDDDFFMFHFKTVFCPYNLFDHDRTHCVYAHNWQDFRRKQSINAHSPQRCLHWRLSDLNPDYPQSCPNGFKCKHAHGQCETDYHPLLFRTALCPQGGECTQINICNYSHNQNQLRILSSLLTSHIFILTEKNRTFKEKNNQIQNVQYSFDQGNSQNMPFPPPGLNDQNGLRKQYSNGQQNAKQSQSKFINPLLKIEENSNLNILKDNLYTQVNSNKKHRNSQSQMNFQSRRLINKKSLNKDSQIYFNEKLYSPNSIHSNTHEQQRQLSFNNIDAYQQDIIQNNS